MHTLSDIELDHLWESLEGHAPGNRQGIVETLRQMEAASAVAVKVTPARVEVQLPLILVAFDRQK